MLIVLWRSPPFARRPALIRIASLHCLSMNFAICASLLEKICSYTYTVGADGAVLTTARKNFSGNK
jgi:hypothetical protein